MAGVSGSRGRTLEPQSGGKMVRARRPAGSRTPYERPKLDDSDTGNPNWISKLILSPTRAIATGAGKLISTVFSQDESDSDSDSDSDSSSESDSGSEGNVENDYDEDDSLSQRANLLKESNKSEKVNYFRKDPEPKAGKRDKLRAIEELLMQETFSREEYNRLLKIIESRVVDGKDVDSQRLTKTPKEKSEEEEEKNLRCTAVMEARRWLSEKKSKSAQKSYPTNVDEDEVGSPEDMAKLYMRARPLWASPSPMGALLFDEATPSSVGSISLPSTKLRRDTPASGSWNIKEELQRVRAKASEEMLSTLPSKKIDWSSFGLEKRAVPYPLIVERMHSSVKEKDKSELLNAYLRTVTQLSNSKGLEPTPLETQNEASLPNEVNINLENNQDSQAAHIHEGAGPTSVFEEMVCEEPRLPLGNSFHTEAAPEQEATQNNEDCNLAHLSSNNNLSDTFGDETCELPTQTPMDNIPRSPQLVAMYKVPAPEQQAKLDVDEEDHNSVSSSSNKNTSDAFVEETCCELLTESSMDDIPRSPQLLTEDDAPRSQQVPPRYSTRKVSKRGQAGEGVKQPGKKPSRYSRT